MDCTQARDHLRGLLDGSLTGPDLSSVEDHLEGCTSCQTELDHLASEAGSGLSQPSGAIASPRPDYLDSVKAHGPPAGFEGPPQKSDRSSTRRGRYPKIAGFEVIRELGRGGMGVVYEAVELALNRRVALKILPPQATAVRKGAERFRREARAAAKLHHTNIVPVFGVGEDDDQLYFAMQLIEGESLDRLFNRLRRDRPAAAADDAAGSAPPPSGTSASPIVEVGVTRVAEGSPLGTTSASEPRSADGSRSHSPASMTRLSADASDRSYARTVARIGQQVAEALAYAHAQGVIHRDVKPSNLLIDVSGAVWVADFGLAKSIDGDGEGLTTTGDFVGTLRYMAPERFDGRSEPRSDIYALGVTLYELLTLRPLFETSDRVRLIERILHEEPPRPRALDLRVPRDLETVVLKAMAKEPSARYASAGELAEDLRRFLAGETVFARRVGPAERIWRWSKRNRAVAALVAACLVSLVVGLVGVTWQWRVAVGQKREAVDARRDGDAARQLAVHERNDSRRVLSGVMLEKGQVLAEEGKIDEGLHWILQALKTAPDSAADFRVAARRGLAAWLSQAHSPRLIIEHDTRWFDYNDLMVGPVFSPDSGMLVTSPHKPGLGLTNDFWDLSAGRRLRSIPGFGSVPGSRLFSRGGRVLLRSTPDKGVVALDLATGRPLWPPPGRPLKKIWTSFLPDGNTFLTRGVHDPLSVWDSATGRALGAFLIGGDQGTAIRDDGRMIAASSNRDGESVTLADATGHVIAVLSIQRDGTLYPALSPDGTRLLVNIQNKETAASLPSVQLWDISRQPAQLIATAFGQASRGVFLLDGSAFVTIDNDRVEFRESSTGRRMAPAIRPKAFVDYTAVSPDGRSLLTVSDLTAVLWSLASDSPFRLDKRREEPPTRLEGRSSGPGRAMVDFAVSNSRLGLTLVSSSTTPGRRNVLRLLDNGSGRFVGPPIRTGLATLFSAAFSPDGRRIAAGGVVGTGLAGEVRIWDARTGQPVTPPMRHANWVRTVAFSRDGTVLAAGDYQGLVKLWDPVTGRPLHGSPLPQGDIVSVLEFSPDGSVLAVARSSDHSRQAGLRLWDVASGRPIGEFHAVEHSYNQLIFSPDGRVFLARDGYGARLRESATGRRLGEPMNGAFVAVFHPSGKTLLTGQQDGGLRLRDAGDGRIIGSAMVHPEAITALAISPDGLTAACGCADGTVRLWDIPSARPIGPPRDARESVRHLAFAADGRSVLSVTIHGDARSWPVAIAQTNDLDRLTHRVEALSGLHMEGETTLSPLGTAAWRARIAELAGLEIPSTASEGPAAWYDRRARDAESSGDRFAALWNLDRLIALRPDDWTVFARRSQQYESAGDFAASDADIDRATRLATPDVIRDWHAHRVDETWDAGQPEQTLRALGHLIAARPNDWTLYEARADVFARLGRETEREADLARVVDLGPDDVFVFRRLEEFGRATRWDQAMSTFDLTGRHISFHPAAASPMALALLAVGDRAGYRRLCTSLAERSKTPPPSPGEINDLVSIFVLGPFGLDDYATAIDWEKAALASVPSGNGRARHTHLNTLGGLLCRAEHYRKAITCLDEGVRSAETGASDSDLAFLAMAHHHLGHPLEAQRYRERLSRRTPRSRTNPYAFWPELEIELLSRELESLLDSSLPADPFAH